MALSNNTAHKKKMNVVDAYRLYNDIDRNMIKFTIQRGLDTKNYRNINTLLNPNFMREVGIFMHNVLQKFSRKKYIERNKIQIPLKYIPSKGKIYLDSIYNPTKKPHKEIVIEHKSLSDSIEEPVNLNKIKVEDLQKILEGPSETCVKKTLENTTRFSSKGGDKVTGVLYLRDHIKKCFN